MKKLLPLLGLLAMHTATVAQSPYNTIDSVNINNVNAAVLLHGDMWYNPVYSYSACEFPAGSGKHVGYASNILLSGYENGNQLHLSFAKNRSNTDINADFWPGPLDALGQTNSATVNSWARIWKINQADIDNYLSQTTHTINNTPAAIFEWPAKGSQHARGANNSLLTINEDMAPFHDFNSNGQYEPLAGEYPVMKGDQMLWWIINDNGLSHNATPNGNPLKVQITLTAYAYKKGTLIDNVVYYDYKIKNKSGINYTNVRFGQVVDFDLGNPFNDYVGFDSTYRMGYVYNDSIDGQTNYDYGSNIPSAGLTFVHVPGDNNNTRVPLGGFVLHTTYNDKDEIYYDSAMRTMGPYFNQCADNYANADRKFIMSTGDLSLNSNGTADITTALVVTNPALNNYCPYFDTATISAVADTAWNVAKSLSVTKGLNGKNAMFTLYPNPAGQQITIQCSDAIKSVDIAIYDALGRRHAVVVSIKNNEAEIPIAHLPPGLYTVLLNADGSTC